MGNVAPMTRKKGILPFLGLNLMILHPVLVCLDVFGTCCVHISVELQASLFGSGLIRDPPLQGPRHACLVRTKVGWQRSDLFK